MLTKEKMIVILLGMFLISLPALALANAPTVGEVQLVTTADNDRYLVESFEPFDSLPQPAVAVALGGGGARALVNVGVLKALEEERIPIDLVTGTSMGAIVAVLYGSGISIETIEDMVTGIDLPQMFNLNFPFIHSLLNTREFNQFLEKVSPDKVLEDLPIPTALLSMDLTNGIKYIHTTGSIRTAVQGPYAIPICFAGQPIGDYFLVDAGMTELTPAGAARVLGADFVISTTAYDELPYTDYDNSMRTTIRLINLIKEEYARKVVSANTDVTIAHNVGDYSFMDFHLASQFIDLGYYETKKQIPFIKAELEKRGIPLRDPVKKTDLALEPLLTDLTYDRMILEDLVWKPLFYYGKDHSRFNQSLISAESFSPQYGLELKKGQVSTIFITTGTQFDNLETELRYKKLTPKLDLLGKVRVDKTSINWETNLTYYAPDYLLSAGWTYLGGLNYLHLKNAHHIKWSNVVFQGETDLYLPLEYSRASIGGVTFQKLAYQLNKNFALTPKVLYQNTNVLKRPLIYRGVTSDQPGDLQASLELTYDYKFAYSKELLQVILMTGIQCNQFVDYQSPGNWAIGAGMSFDFKILGLKPSQLNTYVTYDFKAEKPKLGIDLDFSF